MSTQTLNVSLNEISFFVTRAAVGVGVPFGVAEDFAKAVMWSARCGVDPAVVALSSLERLDAAPGCGQMSRNEKGAFKGKAGLSPAYGGTALTDFWPLGEPVLAAHNVNNPLLAAAALALNGPASTVVEWPGVRMALNDGTVDITASDREALTNPGPADISVRKQSDVENGLGAFSLGSQDLNEAADNLVQQGVDVDIEAWNGVVAFFRRCLVPSSQLSRMSGAGAGLVDTD